MRRTPRPEYRPRAIIDKEAADHMHRLGAAYAELATYWLTSEVVSHEVASAAYETACQIHYLAQLVDELYRQRRLNSYGHKTGQPEKDENSHFEEKDFF